MLPSWGYILTFQPNGRLSLIRADCCSLVDITTPLEESRDPHGSSRMTFIPSMPEHTSIKSIPSRQFGPSAD